MVPDIPDSVISFVWQIFLPYVFYYLCAFVQMYCIFLFLT